VIELIPYDPAWPDMFEAEAGRIREALGERAMRIEHVGSTAVPGLTAKPVIDIQVSVASLGEIGPYEEKLSSLGYEHIELDDFDREYPYFRRPGEGPSTHHVHLCEADSYLEAKHIAFRDFLRANPDVAERYVELKRSLAARHHGGTLESREKYSLGKTDFVESVIRRAYENRAEVLAIGAEGSTQAWRMEMFRKYAEERREAAIPGYRLERLADLTRHLPSRVDGEALLSFARLPAATADRRIREELDHLRGHGWEAEWKVHDFDQPSDLRSRLGSRGLTTHHIEALMVLDVTHARVRAGQDGDIVIGPASGAQIEELACLQEEIWKCRLPWLAGVLREMVDPVSGTGVAFCARSADRIVGSGWIDFHGGSNFAQLSGGAVLEAYRGRGVYSMLFERRLIEAKARGVPFIAVDAAPMSRPILERKGFVFVCHTYPMRTRPFDTRAVTRS
jgi:GrpB-like predicted nucleotidyltransferase (UPF0157 family)/GNAT superfamily N-acetyltransferase